MGSRVGALRLLFDFEEGERECERDSNRQCCFQMLRWTFVMMIGQLIRSLNWAWRSGGSCMLCLSQQPPSPLTRPSTSPISSHGAKRPAYYSSAALSTRFPRLPRRTAVADQLTASSTARPLARWRGGQRHFSRESPALGRNGQVDGSARCEWYRQCRYLYDATTCSRPSQERISSTGGMQSPTSR